MSCCTTTGTGKFFNDSAGYYAWRFRRRGLDAPQRIIVGALRSLGFSSRTILEVGCGVGGLHLTLLKEGAASAFGSELSERMIAKAKEFASTMGFGERVKYFLGDVATSNGSIPTSDIVILDKVVCCYHDPNILLARVGVKCRGLLVVSYPRNAFLPRTFFKIQSFLGTIFHWSFTAMYHEPSEIDSTIEALFFHEVFAGNTLIWQVKVFQKSATP